MRLDNEGDRRQETGGRRSSVGFAISSLVSQCSESDTSVSEHSWMPAQPSGFFPSPVSCLLPPGADEW